MYRCDMRGVIWRRKSANNSKQAQVFRIVLVMLASDLGLIPSYEPSLMQFPSMNKEVLCVAPPEAPTQS